MEEKTVNMFDLDTDNFKISEPLNDWPIENKISLFSVNILLSLIFDRPKSLIHNKITKFLQHLK